MIFVEFSDFFAKFQYAGAAPLLDIKPRAISHKLLPFLERPLAALMILYAAKPELETDTLCTKSLRIEKNSSSLKLENMQRSNFVFLISYEATLPRHNRYSRDFFLQLLASQSSHSK